MCNAQTLYPSSMRLRYCSGTVSVESLAVMWLRWWRRIVADWLLCDSMRPALGESTTGHRHTTMRRHCCGCCVDVAMCVDHDGSYSPGCSGQQRLTSNHLSMQLFGWAPGNCVGRKRLWWVEMGIVYRSTIDFEKFANQMPVEVFANQVFTNQRLSAFEIKHSCSIRKYQININQISQYEKGLSIESSDILHVPNIF